MELFGIAMMAFVIVLLIVSIYYISSTIRHKEKMLMLEKGIDPIKSGKQNFYLETVRAGFVMIGAGLGFTTGTIIETQKLFAQGIELPLYIAPILIFGGLALLLFYKLFKSRS